MSTGFYRVLRPLFFAAMLMVPLAQCRAVVPSGNVSFTFTNEIAPLWNLSTTFHIEQTLVGPGLGGTPLSFDVAVVNEGNGRLHGTGTIIVNIGSDAVAADYVAIGRVSAGRVTLSVRLRGEGTVGGASTPFQMTVSYRLQINPQDRVLVGTARGHARFGRLGSSAIRSPVSIALADGMDGTWRLDLSIVALRKLAGTGFITLSDGRVLRVAIIGTYSQSLDLARVRLIGIGESRGINLLVNFVTNEDGESQIVSMRGVVLGQRVTQ